MSEALSLCKLQRLISSCIDIPDSEQFFNFPAPECVFSETMSYSHLWDVDTALILPGPASLSNTTYCGRRRTHTAPILDLPILLVVLQSPRSGAPYLSIALRRKSAHTYIRSTRCRRPAGRSFSRSAARSVCSTPCTPCPLSHEAPKL